MQTIAKSFDPPEAWRPFGAFSQAVIGGGGQTICLKGQVALAANGEVVGGRDMSTQVEQVLRNMEASSAGG